MSEIIQRQPTHTPTAPIFTRTHIYKHNIEVKNIIKIIQTDIKTSNRNVSLEKKLLIELF